MKDDSLSDVQPFMMIDMNETRDLAYMHGFGDLYDKATEVVNDPWIVGKDDHWFIHNDKRLHKESWNMAIDAAITEVEKTYPYSAKEIKILRDNLK